MNIIPSHLILISLIVFGILNIIENLIHYNIGRNSDSDKFIFYNPPLSDWIHLIVVMFIFGILQGIITEHFAEKY
jgi:hypothetical protein